MIFVACLALLVLGEDSVAAARHAQGLAGDPAAQMCSFRARTGAPCLGCGGTEAFGHAARGRFARAVVANPLGAWSGVAAWALLFASGLALAGGGTRVLRLALLSVAATLPAAFVVNAFIWWVSLPPGSMPGR
jgi:uncharacterized protein DUF2752